MYWCCVSKQTFYIKKEKDYWNLREVKVSVPQGSKFGPVLHLRLIHDTPELPKITITFC